MPGDRSASSAGLAALQLVLEEEHYRALPAEDLLGRYLGERDERAFAALVRRYGRLVMARCREVLGREDLAQEAFQETFTQLVLNGHLVRRRGAVGRWLSRTAQRRSLNVARRERRQKARDLSVDPRPGGADPQTAVADADVRQVLTRAMTALPERFRLPIELVYLDGMTHAEAASALGCPKGTIDSYVRRGLEKLKRALGPSSLPLVAGGTIALIAPAEAVSAECIQRAMQAATTVPIPPPPGPMALLGERLMLPSVIAGAAVVVVAVAVGWAQWPETHPERKPAPVEPVPPAVVESLAEQNLRLLRAEIGPRLCEALQPLARPGTTVDVAKTDSYDSRVHCAVEADLRPKVPGAGERSRVEFFFDTATRRTEVYLRAHAEGPPRRIDLDRPVVLAKIPELKLELTMHIPELTSATRAFEDLPRDPRAATELGRRQSALRNKLRAYEGPWLRGGDPGQVCRVEFIEPLGAMFYRHGDTAPFRVVPAREVWNCEGTPRFAEHDRGLLGLLGLCLSADGRTLSVGPAEPAWVRPSNLQR